MAMFQSVFHRNAKKQTGTVTGYNEIGQFSYLGGGFDAWKKKKKRAFVVIIC